ncbi:MAG TPA: DUF1844 domain-containing protein [Acidimicrobiales bacterium]|nr:DUF1844 domain-containing protein [Acidimicrobiales bacterium]
MSSLWTPDGERPVGRPSTEGAGGEPPDRGERAGHRGDPKNLPPDTDDDALTAQVEAMRAELANSPVEIVVANHCYGLFELAAVYLSQLPPLLDQARLAIDALGCLVDGLEGRLGETEEQLKDGLSQLRLAYVQIDGAQRAGAEVASSAGANGGSPPPVDAPSGTDPEG